MNPCIPQDGAKQRSSYPHEKAKILFGFLLLAKTGNDVSLLSKLKWRKMDPRIAGDTCNYFIKLMFSVWISHLCVHGQGHLFI